jgi:hypothetical protein
MWNYEVKQALGVYRDKATHAGPKKDNDQS